MARLIDADELIEIAHRIRLDSRERIEQMIESAPTVDPVKHGHWINISIYADGIVSSAECDLCGAIVHNNFSSIINYCPNCGAKMDEVKEDD